MAMRRVKVRRKGKADATCALEEAIRAKVEAEVEERLSQVSQENDLLLDEKAALKRELAKVVRERDKLVEDKQYIVWERDGLLKRLREVTASNKREVDDYDDIPF